jgi:hypothetical protein
MTLSSDLRERVILAVLNILAAQKPVVVVAGVKRLRYRESWEEEEEDLMVCWN